MQLTYSRRVLRFCDFLIKTAHPEIEQVRRGGQGWEQPRHSLEPESHQA